MRKSNSVYEVNLVHTIKDLLYAWFDESFCFHVTLEYLKAWHGICKYDKTNVHCKNRFTWSAGERGLTVLCIEWVHSVEITRNCCQLHCEWVRMLARHKSMIYVRFVFACGEELMECKWTWSQCWTRGSSYVHVRVWTSMVASTLCEIHCVNVSVNSRSPKWTGGLALKKRETARKCSAGAADDQDYSNHPFKKKQFSPPPLKTYGRADGNQKKPSLILTYWMNS